MCTWNAGGAIQPRRNREPLVNKLEHMARQGDRLIGGVSYGAWMSAQDLLRGVERCIINALKEVLNGLSEC